MSRKSCKILAIAPTAQIIKCFYCLSFCLISICISLRSVFNIVIIRSLFFLLHVPDWNAGWRKVTTFNWTSLFVRLPFVPFTSSKMVDNQRIEKIIVMIEFQSINKHDYQLCPQTCTHVRHKTINFCFFPMKEHRTNKYLPFGNLRIIYNKIWYDMHAYEEMSCCGEVLRNNAVRMRGMDERYRENCLKWIQSFIHVFRTHVPIVPYT